MLGLNPSFLWHLIFQLCCIVKLRKVAISKLVWPNNKVNRTSEVCCFVFRLHWAGVLTLEQEVKLNLLMSKKQESLVGFEHQICEYLSDVVFDSVVNQCTGKAVPHELSSALSMHKKVVGGTQFS